VFFKGNNQRKGNPSLHQKQMRFFTVLFFVIVLALFGVLLWLVNRSSYTSH
jgi:flagellar biogenesis protein FliO